MPDAPLVSVVVPSFNQGRFIRATIDSILAQDYRPLEIVVVDGGSTDDTLDVLRSYAGRSELQWVSEKDRGVVDAVNKGFARCRGEIVAIQSSDDYYMPGALRRVVETFAVHPDVGLIYGDTVKVDAAGNEISRHRIGPFSLERLFLLQTWIPQPSAFFRKALLDRVGGWDERIPFAPDTDLWIRMAFRTRVLKIDEFLSARRVHSAQRDVQAKRIARDYARMIEQSREIACAPHSIRRAAHAGKYLIRIRYNERGSDWYAAWSLLCAARHVPSSFDARRFLTHLAWLPLHRLGSKMKRRPVGRKAGPQPR